jgi:hypothetical protein
MSKTEVDTRLPAAPVKSVKPLLQDSRIDAAHTINGQINEQVPVDDRSSEQVNADLVNADHVTAAAAEPASEQLKRQAEQLAEYLRERQKELDHREAQMNAEIAQLEAEVRNARMCLGEREAELEQRRLELDHRENEFLERLDRLATADAALERQAVKASDQAARSPVLDAREEQIRENAAILQRRRQELEEAEKCFSQARAEVQKLHEQLIADRLELRDEIRLERQRLVLQQRQAMAELEKKRKALDARGEHVEQCRDSLVKLRAELRQMHREAMEIRLAAEELWMKLSRAVPQAALAQSLGIIRNQLTEHYRLANDELHDQKKGLLELRDQLLKQHDGIVEEKRNFDRLTTARQEESEQQASALLGREQELLERQTRFDEQANRWQIEKMEYEQEIRRLRMRLSGQSDEPATI